MDQVERLARIEEKLDTLLLSRTDQEGRLRDLEKRNAQVVGACALLSVVLPMLAKKLGLL